MYSNSILKNITDLADKLDPDRASDNYPKTRDPNYSIEVALDRIADVLDPEHAIEIEDKQKDPNYSIEASIQRICEHWPEVGTMNYNELENKPKINGVTLSGNVSLNDIGVPSEINRIATEIMRHDIDLHTYYIDVYRMVYDAYHNFESSALAALGGETKGTTQTFYEEEVSTSTDFTELMFEIKGGFDHCGSVRLLMDYDGTVIEMTVTQFIQQQGKAVIHRVSTVENTVMCSADIEFIQGDHMATVKCIGVAARI